MYFIRHEQTVAVRARGALLSLCVGAALDEALHMARNRKSEARDRDSNELFQRRLRCKSEADAYARRSSEDNSTFMLVEKVEFSPARHSCIGAFARAMSGRRGTLYSGECAENDVPHVFSVAMGGTWN
jgi:hypothetical protein